MRVYDIQYYGSMIRDSLRTDAYAQALEKCVKADSVVLDMGTGAGILAMLACRFGACPKSSAPGPAPIINEAD